MLLIVCLWLGFGHVNVVIEVCRFLYFSRHGSAERVYLNKILAPACIFMSQKPSKVGFHSCMDARRIKGLAL